MAEWSNAAVLKTAEPETVPGVRIPLLPPFHQRLQPPQKLDVKEKRARSTRLRALKRLGRRSPHARSRISALGACIAADSPTPFEEVCLRCGLMTGPSNHFGLKRFRGEASGQPISSLSGKSRLLGCASVTSWCTAT